MQNVTTLIKLCIYLLKKIWFNGKIEIQYIICCHFTRIWLKLQGFLTVKITFYTIVLQLQTINLAVFLEYWLKIQLLFTSLFFFSSKSFSPHFVAHYKLPWTNCPHSEIVCLNPTVMFGIPHNVSFVRNPNVHLTSNYCTVH